MSVRLVIRLYDDDLLVHEFTRSTTNVEGIPRMLGSAMGWMQAYGAVVNVPQWAADVNRVREQAAALAAEATEERAG